uniref:BZIP domain-containing protein n=1 Tax=Anopheles farauti TaxID=69004 RepID=A0A182QTB8_9DIPT
MENFVHQNYSGADLTSTQSYHLHLLHLNRMFQQLYQSRLEALMLEAHQQQQKSSIGPVMTPPSTPNSSIEEDCARNLQIRQDLLESLEPSSSVERVPEIDHSRVRRVSPKKIRFNPYDLQRRSKHLSAVSVDTPVEVELTYNKNMVRTRSSQCSTPEEKKRRLQNTYAARLSRAKTRTLQMMLEKEHNEEAAHNQSLKRSVAAQKTYVGMLQQLLGMQKQNHESEWNTLQGHQEQLNQGN